jgi:predicted small lipoprotein YifL
MPTLITTKKSFALAIFCVFCAVLGGCGTKGPLYIPEQQYPQAKAAQ